MNRIDFMTGLNNLLADIPEAERVAAIQYYNDYFEDAGYENEANVIRELESPAKVAEKIKEDLGIDKDAVLRLWQMQAAPQNATAEQNMAAQNQEVPQSQSTKPFNEQVVQNEQAGQTQQGGSGRWIAVLCTAPLWIAFICMMGGLIAALGGMVFGFGVASIAVLGSGILMIVWSIPKFGVAPFGAMITLGVGLLMIAIAIGFFFALYGFVKLIPACVRAIGRFCRWLFKGGRA